MKQRAANALVLLLAMLAVSGCRKRNRLLAADDRKSKKDYTLQQTVEELAGLSSKIDVLVVTLKPSSIREELTLPPGDLIPNQSEIIKPLADGRLHFVAELDVGDRIEEGQLIAKIDSRDLLADIKIQEQQMEIAQEQIRQDESELQNKRKDLEFDEELAKKDYITFRELEKSRLTVDQAAFKLN